MNATHTHRVTIAPWRITRDLLIEAQRQWIDRNPAEARERYDS